MGVVAFVIRLSQISSFFFPFRFFEFQTTPNTFILLHIKGKIKQFDEIIYLKWPSLAVLYSFVTPSLVTMPVMSSSMYCSNRF